MIKTINTLFVTMFGLGKIPKIPGTFGSFATVIILYFFFHIFNSSSTFISRGDDSGTHFKEMNIWKEAKLNPLKFSGNRYR